MLKTHNIFIQNQIHITFRNSIQKVREFFKNLPTEPPNISKNHNSKTKKQSVY